jgi:hypothetical protein
MTLQTYINSDNSIDFNSAVQTISSVPVGVYIPKYSDMRGIYLTRTNDFKYLDEYYLLDKFEDYVLQSFKNSTKSLGVLYVGLKGSGKTKRAHKLALDSGLPILYIQDLNIINKPAWKDVVGTDIFNNFVIFIDEYEKKLEELEDETSIALLEWLDGSTNNKQLFILIGNEKANNKFSNPLIDRLSRVLWRKTFGSLEETEVRELVYKLSIRDDKEDLIDNIISIPVLSLDNTLQIIKTTNLFNDTNIEELINMLNIEFNMYDEFFVCDEQNNQIEDDSDTYPIYIKKDKVLFKHNDMYTVFNNSFVEKLALTNDDINKAEDVYFDLAYTNLNVKVINKNKLSISVNYKYTSLTTKEKVTSEEPITLFLLKDTLYYSLSKFNNKFLSFAHAI